MHISTTLIGTDFTPSFTPICNENGQPLYYITDTDDTYVQHKQHYDKRTGFLNVEFTPAKQNSVLTDLTWYNNYMKLNYILLSSFMAENPGRQLPVLNMLNIGYIPVGYAPSFLSDVNPFIVRLLELRKVPYVLYRSTVMGNLYYKNDSKDVWVSKIDAAKYLGCSPEQVTFTNLLGGLLSHG